MSRRAIFGRRSTKTSYLIDVALMPWHVSLSMISGRRGIETEAF